MVAHLVRLKRDLLRNSFRRSRAQAIGMVLGIAYAGFVVLGLTLALGALRGSPDVAPVVVTLGGATGFVMWIVLPIFAFGSDPTLDPTRFATFSIRPRELAIGLVVSALVGLPAAASLLLALGAVVASSQTLASTLMALVSVPIGLLTAITVSRWVSAVVTGAVSSRRGRDATAMVAALLFVLIVPVVSLVGGSRRDWRGLAETAAAVVGWTPVGWAWAAPGDVSAGHPSIGLVRLCLAALALLVGLRLWAGAIRRQVEEPRGTSRVGPRSTDPGDLGLLGRVPDDPTWAVAARTAIYWGRDPRYQVSMFLTPLAPLALLIPYLASDIAWVPLLMGPLAAFLLGWSEHNAVAYESTAFWMHLSSALSGRSDRLGRLLPNVGLAAFLVPVHSVAGAWVGGRWDLLPAMLGLSAVLLGGGYAVSSLLSVALPYPVPKPGESPFHSPPGAAGMTMLSQTVASLGTAVLAAPVLVLSLLAWAGASWAVWVALVAGVALGPLLLWLGLRLGGALYERRAPELLLTLSAD